MLALHEYKKLIVDETIRLEMIDDHHAKELFRLVERNRKTLGEWLPWVPHMERVEDFSNYIHLCKTQHEAGTDYGFMIMLNDMAVGRIGLHYISQQNRSGAIGYWIGDDFSGKGIITKSCKTMIRFALELVGLNRIEIKCATGNIKSAAVAERLHFMKEGVLREAEHIDGKFHDLYLFSLLKNEWKRHAGS